MMRPFTRTYRCPECDSPFTVCSDFPLPKPITIRILIGVCSAEFRRPSSTPQCSMCSVRLPSFLPRLYAFALAYIPPLKMRTLAVSLRVRNRFALHMHSSRSGCRARHNGLAALFRAALSGSSVLAWSLFGIYK